MVKRKFLLGMFSIFVICSSCFISYGDELEYESSIKALEEYSVDRDLDGEKETRIQIDRNTKEIVVGEKSIGYTGYLYDILYEDLTGDGYLEMIPVMKDEGTSSSLRYRVYDIKYIEDIRVIFERNNIYRGMLAIQENTIVEKIPLYFEEDFNAVPREYKENRYIYNSKKEKFELALESYKDTKALYNNSAKKEASTYYENPDRSEIEALIEAVANEKAIPPVILKAIAYTESNFKQFKNGNPLVSFDGVSYGIMQVTPSIHTEYDIDRLKYDIRYNIEAGAEILLGKWGLAFSSNPVIPKINGGDPRVLENWYFAVWAYNGWSECNNPNMIPYEHSTWVQTKAYQDKVLDYAESEFDQEITKVAKASLPETGLPSKYDTFETSLPYHIHEFEIYGYGDLVTNMTKYGLALRNDAWDKIEALSPRTAMVIINGPRLYNGYIRYKVETITEAGEVSTGWVAMNWTRSIRDSDVNCDGITDLDDLAKINNHIGETDDSSLEIYDMNYDDCIDSYDVLLANREYENYMAYEDYTILPRKTGVSPDKDWTVKFNSKLKSNSINNKNIYVENRESGEISSAAIKLLNNGESIKIYHPDENYISGNIYLIVITQGVLSYENKALKQPVIMEFVVE